MTFSCHSAGIWRTRSRTDTIRCTSTPSPKDVRARSIWVGEAVERISWLMIEVPGQARTSRGEPVPRADGLRLEPAPREPHQVERRQEVPVEAVARDRGCPARAAPRGCGTARPADRTCRSSGCRRAAGPSSPLVPSTCRPTSMRTARSSTSCPDADARRCRRRGSVGTSTARIADDRVASAAAAVAPSAPPRPCTHSRCSSGSATGGVPVAGIRGSERAGHQRGPLVRRHQQPDHGGDPPGQLGRVGSRPDGRRQAAYAESSGSLERSSDDL